MPEREELRPVSTHSTRVLMVGPGSRMHGGITQVIRLLRTDPLWREYGCDWLETCDDCSAAANLFALLRGAARFPFAVRGRQIVHIHAGAKTSFVRKSLFFFAAKALRRTVIVQLHTTDVLFPTTPEPLIRAVLTHADAVIVLCSRFADELRGRFPGLRLHVMKNPVGDGLPVARRHDIGEVNVVFLGRVERRKGIFDLLGAFARVHQACPEARLRVAGPGDIATALRVCREFGIERSVEFLGWVGGDAKSELLQSADIFCLPSREEALPLSLLEAMSCGLPSICTDVGAVPEVLNHGASGLIVPAGDVLQLAAALRMLIECPALRAQYGAAAAEAVMPGHSLRAVASGMRRLYQLLAERQVAGLPARRRAQQEIRP